MRRAPGRLLALLVALAVAAALLPTLASASEQAARLFPENLRLDDNEGPWSSRNSFQLRWERPAVTHEGFPITGADYRVRSAAGNVVVPERHISGDVVSTDSFAVPWSPGAYTADLWLEGPGGERGPQVSTMLGYDTARPGLAQPLFPAVWAGASQAAVVKISHPSGPLPVAGIRGYAISVDRGAGSLPCAGRERCTMAETDLDGGIGDDEIALKELSEGTHYVRALAVSRAGMRSLETRTTIVKVDTIRPDTSLAGAPPGWANGPVRVTATATDSMSGMVANGPNGPFTAVVIDGAVPRTDQGPSTSAMVTGQGVHTVAHYARDAAGNFSGVEPRVSLVRIDESPPAVAFAKSQDPAEPERIEASVSDSLSGPDPARGSIALRPAGSHQPFAPLPTAVSGGRLVARWNSDAFPAGPTSSGLRATTRPATPPARTAASTAFASCSRTRSRSRRRSGPALAVAAWSGIAARGSTGGGAAGGRRSSPSPAAPRCEPFPTGAASPTPAVSLPPRVPHWPACRWRSSRASMPAPTCPSARPSSRRRPTEPSRRDSRRAPAAVSRRCSRATGP